MSSTIASFKTSFKFRNFNPLLNIWVAIIYVLGARLGQLFAIEPANVTPVWIPSGILLALALHKGPQIWPGVFVGAFSGNIWAYFSTVSLSSMLAAIGSAALNGIGDVISIVVMAQLIIKANQSTRVLNSHRSLLYFILFGAFLGPLVSAVMGTLGLFIFGHIAYTAIAAVLLTWFLGDSIGVVVLTPFLLSWLYQEEQFNTRRLLVLVLATLYALLVTGVIFGVVQLPELLKYGVFIFLPALFYSLIHLGQRLVFSVQVAALSLAVVATALNYGPFAASGPDYALTFLQLFAGVFSLVLFVFAILNLDKARSNRLLEQRTQELEELYRKDALTKLWNRYRIKEFLDFAMIRFRRDQRSFGVLLIDIDDFKKINDQHGHLIGDQVLVELSAFIQSHIREADFLGRWGGEEFILITSETSKEAIQLFSQKILSAINEHHFKAVDTAISVSIGVSLVKAADTELTLMDRVDAALYRAKNNGKDQYVLIAD